MFNDVTTIRLSPELRAVVREYAETNALKEGSVIRMAVKRFFDLQKTDKDEKRKQKK